MIASLNATSSSPERRDQAQVSEASAQLLVSHSSDSGRGLWRGEVKGEPDIPAWAPLLYQLQLLDIREKPDPLTLPVA
ncbi:peptidyl-prolyl cis-trans isomerase FKBP8-like protein [Lates japonicus]|uniref:Peptidyl-prolyl cis-trans isomerase FKBP8-like protein n=1 Tax=Lates japonicus TaxID=270547 RepID=A0AAD3MQ29_LATJO|nr:peptidyl-prolyl cis-trans isomerase FKBP8-like protein [Lates japonicus]